MHIFLFFYKLFMCNIQSLQNSCLICEKSVRVLYNVVICEEKKYLIVNVSVTEPVLLN